MGMTRREFLKYSAATSAVMALGGHLSPAAGDKTAAGGAMDKWVTGVCRFCGTGCGVMVGVKGGRVVTVKGGPNNHNAGFLCLKGALMPPITASRATANSRPLPGKPGSLLH